MVVVIVTSTLPCQSVPVPPAVIEPCQAQPSLVSAAMLLPGTPQQYLRASGDAMSHGLRGAVGDARVILRSTRGSRHL